MQDIYIYNLPFHFVFFTPAYETLLSGIRIISRTNELKGTQIWNLRDLEGERGWTVRRDAAKSDLRGRFRKFQENQGRDFGGCYTVSEMLSEREKK